MQKQNLEIDYRYNWAKRKAKDIKSFYINLVLFCICMPIIIGVNIFVVPEFQWFWFSLLGWGSGVLVHGISAFELFPFLSKNWESKKLREFMNEDNQKKNN